jgi:hypothetical protein
VSCTICGCPIEPWGRAIVLGKYDVGYVRCVACGFVRTEHPYWLDEAYASPIVAADIGSVHRALSFGRITRRLILACFEPGARFLDYGGGYGLFTRLMRDWGLDFYHYDRYCQNLLAVGCEGDVSGATGYELLTAFEVFEHLADPIAEIARMLGLSRSLLFSTQLIPPSRPAPGEWWYYAPGHGQHVAFYTRAAIDVIARRFGLRAYSDGSSLHLLTDRRIDERWFRLLVRHPAARLLDRPLARRLPRASLLADDFARLSGIRLP